MTQSPPFQILTETIRSLPASPGVKRTQLFRNSSASLDTTGQIDVVVVYRAHPQIHNKIVKRTDSDQTRWSAGRASQADLPVNGVGGEFFIRRFIGSTSSCNALPCRFPTISMVRMRYIEGQYTHYHFPVRVVAVGKYVPKARLRSFTDITFEIWVGVNCQRNFVQYAAKILLPVEQYNRRLTVAPA
jgi:hypothetical protein